MAQVIRKNFANKTNRVIEILDFEAVITGFNSEYELIVRERENPDNEHMRFYASFHGGSILKGVGRHCVSGNGNSPDQAILDYCAQIGGKELVFGYNKNTATFKIPINLVHKKEIEE
jgi:hypothetical protein